MLQQSNAFEGGPAPGFRMGVNHAEWKNKKPATAETQGNSNETDLLKYKIENTLLIQKLERVQNERSSTKDPNVKRTYANLNDIDLNFNTKTNYVNILEKRIEVLTEALRVQKKEEILAKIRESEMELFEEKANLKNLQAKYTKLKFKYHEIFKYKSVFDKTLTVSRKMRSILKAYEDTGVLNKTALRNLNLNSFDRVLDSNNNPYNEDENHEQGEEEEEGVIEIPNGANEGVYKTLIDKQNKIILLNRKVMDKELEVKETQETIKILKEKTKKQDERIRKMMKDSQMQASKIMSSQIKASSISRDAISRSIMNMRSWAKTLRR